jgi:NADPH:quinone reductase-like Zn-dependent oxidoreductase
VGQGDDRSAPRGSVSYRYIMSPATTRAILIVRHGPPEALIEREVPLRDVGPDDVQLKVLAAGVNFADLLMRAGLYGTVPPRPYSPGFEVAGEVVRTGARVEGWRVGDRAVALIRFGGYARDVVASARQLFRYPETLTPVEAAAVPVVFLTAWVALFEAARARAGETVLILGAGGGVGTAAVQLAVWRGLKAIGTAGSQKKRDFVTGELGAEACFDARGDWEAEVRRLVGPRGIDVALDAVGGRATASCRRLLAPLGRLVFYGLSNAMLGDRRSWLGMALAWLRTPRFHPLSLIEPNVGVFGVHLLHLKESEAILRPALDEVYRSIVAGELKPIVDRTFSLDRAGAVEAHRYLHARANLGKVVLQA